MQNLPILIMDVKVQVVRRSPIDQKALLNPDLAAPISSKILIPKNLYLFLLPDSFVKSCLLVEFGTVMALKRTLGEPSSGHKAKKLRTDSHKSAKIEKPQQNTPSLLTTEVDFPRGGGTSFTPLEVKAIRAEAVHEANAELFEVTEIILTSSFHLTDFLVGRY